MNNGGMHHSIQSSVKGSIMRSTVKAGGGAMRITSYGLQTQSNKSFANQGGGTGNNKSSSEVPSPTSHPTRSQFSVVAQHDKTNFAYERRKDKEDQTGAPSAEQQIP